MRSTGPFENVASDSEQHEIIHDLKPVEMLITRTEESRQRGIVAVEPVEHWPPELGISDAGDGR